VEGGRTVVHLYGVLENGQPFLARDGRQPPRFWIRSADLARARAAGCPAPVALDRRDMAGSQLARVELAQPADVPGLRERLERAGVRTFEADVRHALRPLIDAGIRGALSIRGRSTVRPGVGRVFEEPEIGPADFSPALRVLSLDIETDPGAQRLLSVALHGCGVSEVWLLTPDGLGCPPDAAACRTEAELIRTFARRVREIDPDILTGWNVVDFDLRVLLRVADRLGVALALGRDEGRLRLVVDGGRGGLRARIPGRVVLDGIQLLRGSFVRMEDYSLDAVAREVLGEGKTLSGHGRPDEILRLFEQDRPRFVAYNRTDARLALQILERLRLVELSVERSRLTGLPVDRVSASIASFDFLYMTELARRGIAAPSVAGDADAEPQAGGHVLEPVPGLHANVVVLDFRSLYPSVIRTFGIDPLGLLAQVTDDAVVSPSGAAFSRAPGILPALLDRLAPAREQALAAGDKVPAQAIKILMNSFYGVLGTPASRFYDPRLPNAITSWGRELLLWTRDRATERGLRVLYGDTDSLFVATGIHDGDALQHFGARLAGELTTELAAHVRRTWGVESRLRLELDRVYLRLVLPALRHAASGARKRYAGLQRTSDGTRVVLTGLEAVRGDWTALARRAQRELYRRLFADEPVDTWLRKLVSEVRAGGHDGELVYRKWLRKPAAEYTASTPPHVAAARLEGRPGRGRVSYVITAKGAEPEHAPTAPLDHEHYVQKQLRPVAEPVLALLGLDFDRVIGDDRQLTLF
jgi:DNA polymerase-2